MKAGSCIQQGDNEIFLGNIKISALIFSATIKVRMLAVLSKTHLREELFVKGTF